MEKGPIDICINRDEKMGSSIRKLLALAASALVLVGLQSTGSAEPRANLSRRESAGAVWLVRSKETYTIFVADVHRAVSVKNGSIKTSVRVDKAPCRVRPGIILCVGDGGEIRKDIAAHDFVMDPALQHASLDFVHRDLRFQATWTARAEEPAMAVQPGIDGHSISMLAGAFRRAQASGNLFGEELTKSNRFSTHLASVNFAYARTEAPKRTVIQVHGQRFRLVIRQ